MPRKVLSVRAKKACASPAHCPEACWMTAFVLEMDRGLEHQEKETLDRTD